MGKELKHIAIIMDGNGRWAKKRALPRNMGHRKGAEQIWKIVKHANSKQIEYLTVYAFSTENWQRPKEEVDYLMNLPIEFFNRYEKEFASENVCVKIIGNREPLSQVLIDKIHEIETKTASNQGIQLNIALNYGAKEEIITALKKIVTNNQPITVEQVEENLYTKGIPPVDLLIRTSGEYRISNFLLWQIAYSELYFTDVYWPDFDEKELDKALVEYAKRERRFGGLS